MTSLMTSLIAFLMTSPMASDELQLPLLAPDDLQLPNVPFPSSGELHSGALMTSDDL
jgi:hypothetical protein